MKVWNKDVMYGMRAWMEWGLNRTSDPLLQLIGIFSGHKAVGVYQLLCPGKGEMREEGRTGELEEPVQIGHHVSSAQVDSVERDPRHHLTHYHTCTIAPLN